MEPGTTMLARMPNGPSSAASARTRPSSPVLAAVTAAVFGRPVRLDCPPIAMMLPRFRSFHRGHDGAPQIECRVEVGREHAAPIVQRRLGDWLVRPDLGVADGDTGGPQPGEPLPD